MNWGGEFGLHKRLPRSSRVRGQKARVSRDLSDRLFSRVTPSDRPLSPFTPSDRVAIVSRGAGMIGNACLDTPPSAALGMRSEERRVGKECVSTCRSRWSPYH